MAVSMRNSIYVSAASQESAAGGAAKAETIKRVYHCWSRTVDRSSKAFRDWWWPCETVDDHARSFLTLPRSFLALRDCFWPCRDRFWPCETVDGYARSFLALPRSFLALPRSFLALSRSFLALRDCWWPCKFVYGLMSSPLVPPVSSTIYYSTRKALLILRHYRTVAALSVGVTSQ